MLLSSSKHHISADMILKNLDRLNWVLGTAREWLESREGLDLTILCGEEKTELKCHKLMLRQFLEKYSGQDHDVDLLILPQFNAEEVQAYLTSIYGLTPQYQAEHLTGEDEDLEQNINLDHGKGVILEAEENEYKEENEIDLGLDKIDLKIENMTQEEIPVKEQDTETNMKCEEEEPKPFTYNRQIYKERWPRKVKHCLVCSERFQFSTEAQAHMLSCHVKELQHRKLLYNVHGKKYVKMIECDDELCDKMFERFKYMKSHKKRIHEGNSPQTITCSVCCKVLKSQLGLKLHMDSIHPEKSDSKRELCSECGEKLPKAGMNQHMLVKHNKNISGKEYRHFCDQCDYKCSTNVLLKEHKLIHTGAKPEICSFCGKAFRAKKTRENHERLHTNSRPYQCQYCEKAFVQRTSLKSHIMVHHKDKNI